MRTPYRTVRTGGDGEYEEKRSRFLAVLRPVHSEEEAAQLLAARRREHWDARHHCFAYRLRGERLVERCGDDGEPAGTGGRPILDVLAGAGLEDVMCIVTRYFGGTLLGTGGLTRAYAAAAQDAAGRADAVERLPGRMYRLTVGYPDLERVRRLCEKEQIRETGAEYAEQVVLTVVLPEGREEALASLRDATAGRISWEAGEETWYENG